MTQKTSLEAAIEWIRIAMSQIQKPVTWNYEAESKHMQTLIHAASLREPNPKDVDNTQRIKVLKEIGFEYQATQNDDGSLREHIITHPDYHGLFINHTNLICAARHALIGIRILAQAERRPSPPSTKPEEKE